MFAFIQTAIEKPRLETAKQPVKVRQVTYQLNPSGDAGSSFYTTLQTCTNELMGFLNPLVEKYTSNYIEYLKKQNTVSLRTPDEYSFELIILGVLWNNHNQKAKNSSRIVNRLLAKLYEMRTSHPNWKNNIDKIRGITSTLFLYQDFQEHSGLTLPANLDEFEKLLSWMQATGEYKQEYIRLIEWIAFLKSSKVDFEEFRQDILRATTIFEWLSVKYLRSFTSSVNDYIEENRHRYEWKENVLFCSRPVNEYHLNMIGAEIMNRALKPGFDSADKKVVLLPACMRLFTDERCKAEVNGLDLVCASCNSACNVARTTKQGQREGFTVRLIPHSSGFSDWLKQWEGTTETGVVGVACLLNLLTGGYEMQSLKIPAQCVFLEHTACEKHWQKNHYPAAIEAGQLSKILH
ncbi:MAG: DUF116 domain-containing protein [Ignavibacteriales bacterium]|nr:DUF116 domain-containing protein [Ignavibacteriales bacterium]